MHKVCNFILFMSSFICIICSIYIKFESLFTYMSSFVYNQLHYNLLEFWGWVYLFTPVMLKTQLKKSFLAQMLINEVIV